MRTAEPGDCGDWKTELGEGQTEFRQLLTCLGLWETEKLTGHVLAVGHDNRLHSVSGTIR